MLEASAWSVWSLVIFFCRIPRLKTLILLNIGWPVSFNRSNIWVVVEFHFPLEVFHTTSFRLQDRRTSRVPARISSRILWLFLNAKWKIHRFLFLSNRCRWTLKVFQVQCSDLENHSRFSGESVMTRILEGIFHSTSISSPSIPSNSSETADIRKSSTCSVHLKVASLLSHIFPRHSTESEFSRTFVFLHWITWSWHNVPWGRCVFNRMHIQNLFRMFQYHFL